MAQATETSPLLYKLSPELRNAISELVLVEPDDISIGTQRQPGLTRTCHRIRCETIRVYFEDNTSRYITTSGGEDRLDGVKAWLWRITATHCAILRRIEIKIGVADGLMITDCTSETDPRTQSVQQMKIVTCRPYILLQVSCFREEMPIEAFLHVLQLIAEAHPERRTLQFWFGELEWRLWYYIAMLSVRYGMFLEV